jgi:hypothetical protein
MKLGPVFVTMIVYVVDVPGTYVVWPLLFDTVRFTCGAAVSVSVADTAEPVPACGVTVTVFTKSAVASDFVSTV